jgi:hypothetical protein
MDGPWLFGADGRYLGWGDPDGQVWQRDGTYLGRMEEDGYVLRDLRRAPPVRRTPPVPPLPAAPPTPSGSRLARPPRPGWADGLAGVSVWPAGGDLAGAWSDGDTVLVLDGGGGFAWHAGQREPRRGRWHLAGTLLVLWPDGAEGLTYRLLEYRGERVTLRRQSLDRPELPFDLVRRREGGG